MINLWDYLKKKEFWYKNMVYEIVELEEKKIVGVSERVRKDETEVEKIKKLWEKFVEETQNMEFLNTVL